MYARMSKLGFSTYNRQYFGDELGGPPIHGGGNPGNGLGYTWSTTVAATYVATTRLIIDTYFGWTLLAGEPTAKGVEIGSPVVIDRRSRI